MRNHYIGVNTIYQATFHTINYLVTNLAIVSTLYQQILMQNIINIKTYQHRDLAFFRDLAPEST